MEIRTIKNGWLVNVRGGQYLGDSCNISEIFFATKDQLVDYLMSNLLTAEEIQRKDEERRKMYESEKAQLANIAGRWVPNVQPAVA